MDKKEGDAAEFADLFTTLCRAKNFPARVVEGFINKQKGGNPKHCWSEVYIERYGWIPFDTAGGVNNTAKFDLLQSNYIYLSFSRNDAILEESHYYWYRQFGEGSVTKVEETFSVEK